MSDETKRCPKRELDLSVDLFDRRRDGRPASYCKRCLSLYCRQHYVKNGKQHNARRVANNIRYRLRNRAYVSEYLQTHPCVDCGETDPVVLEFDHVGVKAANIGDLLGQGVSLDGSSWKSQNAWCGAPTATAVGLRGSSGGRKE
jgi:hypothetical protein